MKQENYLSEIAKIFGIRASALQLLGKRMGSEIQSSNRENNYREPTMQNMLAVYDILFLRSLSIPVDKIRTCFASSLKEISDVFEENERTLSLRIAELESSLVRLKKKSAAIRRIAELRARGSAACTSGCRVSPLRVHRTKERARIRFRIRASGRLHSFARRRTAVPRFRKK